MWDTTTSYEVPQLDEMASQPKSTSDSEAANENRATTEEQTKQAEAPINELKKRMPKKTPKRAKEGEETTPKEKTYANTKTTRTTNGLRIRGRKMGGKPARRNQNGPNKRGNLDTSVKQKSSWKKKKIKRRGDQKRSKPNFYGHNIMVTQI